jgi:hypothetical protein
LKTRSMVLTRVLSDGPRNRQVIYCLLNLLAVEGVAGNHPAGARPATASVMTADDQIRPGRSRNPVLTYHFVGSINGDTAAVLSGSRPRPPSQMPPVEDWRGENLLYWKPDRLGRPCRRALPVAAAGADEREILRAQHAAVLVGMETGTTVPVPLRRGWRPATSASPPAPSSEVESWSTPPLPGPPFALRCSAMPAPANHPGGHSAAPPSARWSAR